MEKPLILHMLTTAKHLSPFDVNMAHDAGWNACMSYTEVTLAEVAGLTQDAIFSRGPKGVARTGIFLGGRDMHIALDMLAAARSAMVPPFEVSVFADPSGAFTTAAAMVASVDDALGALAGSGLKGRRVLVFGGTGPVGSAVALLSARAGADTSVVSHAGLARAAETADLLGRRYGVSVTGADGSSPERIATLMADADAVFNAAAAGVQVLSADLIAAGAKLKVACDANAVPPAGIEGIGPMDNRVALAASSSSAVGLGALAVGNVKYRTQQQLLRQMHEAGSPQYLGLDEAYEVAREYAA
jgi:methylene-tetrahydromethanopterin dehydrogenase